jgi:hypothetical protein
MQVRSAFQYQSHCPSSSEVLIPHFDLGNRCPRLSTGIPFTGTTLEISAVGPSRSADDQMINGTIMTQEILDTTPWHDLAAPNGVGQWIVQGPRELNVLNDHTTYKHIFWSLTEKHAVQLDHRNHKQSRYLSWSYYLRDHRLGCWFLLNDRMPVKVELGVAEGRRQTWWNRRTARSVNPRKVTGTRQFEEKG